MKKYLPRKHILKECAFLENVLLVFVIYILFVLYVLVDVFVVRGGCRVRTNRRHHG